MARGGGMLRYQKDDGTWIETFAVGYGSHRAAINMSNKYHGVRVQVVDKNGKVTFDTDVDDW